MTADTVIAALVAEAGHWWLRADGWLQGGVGVLLDWQAQWQGTWGAWPGAAAFFAVLTLWSAIGVPGCSVVILAIGALYGWVWGTLLVSVATTVGACLAFLVARGSLRARLQQRHGHQLVQIDQLLVRRGAWVLVALRMAPLIPFPLLNPLMGLTSMRLAPFFGWSYVGMLGGTILWVVLGEGLAKAGLNAFREPWFWAGAMSLMLASAAAMWWGQRAGLSRRRGDAMEHGR